MKKTFPAKGALIKNKAVKNMHQCNNDYIK